MGGRSSAELKARETKGPSDRLEPFNFEEPSFDPNYGFPNGRKPRVMHVSSEELRSAQIAHENRDYCAHKLIEYQTCKRANMPFVYKCHHEKHAHLMCEYDDYILRMKEFEREKRLRAREQRILAMEIKA